MEPDAVRAGPPRFDILEEDYRAWSTYAKAYLKNRGVWSVVFTPRPILPANPGMVEPPTRNPTAAAAAMVAVNADRVARKAVEKTVVQWDRRSEVALSDI